MGRGKGGIVLPHHAYVAKVALITEKTVTPTYR
jgi:hypothetical protein